MSEEAGSPRKPRGFRVLMGVLAVIGLVLAAEGALNLGSMIMKVSREAQPVPSAHRFTMHDRLLGWVAEPGLREADAYGEWRPLTTLPSGLRGASDPAQQPADGQWRIICGGGASVFGVGVADDDTWCARLGAGAENLETVNAGQPGHGPGQAWVLLRDRLALKADLLLFALDGADMFRLLSKQDARFPKPRIEPGQTGLDVKNTPIPGRPFLWPWVTFNAPLFEQSRLLAPLVGRPPPESMNAPAIPATVVMTGLLSELQALAENRGAQLVVTYLPSHPAFQGRADAWRRNLAGHLETRQVPFIDLTDDQGPRPSAAPRELFDGQAQLTALGHQQVAEALRAELSALSLEGFNLPGTSTGPWRARNFEDAVFQVPAGTRHHATSSLDWGEGAPLPGMPDDGFSVILDSCLPLEEPRRIRVRLEADGAATLAVNGQTVLDTGEGEGPLFRVNAVDLPAGGNRVRVRYRDSAGQAHVRVMFRFEDGRVVIPGSPLMQAPGSAQCGDSAGAGGRSEG